MKFSNIRWGLAALAIAALSACGGSSSTTDVAPTPVVVVAAETVKDKITTASAVTGNDAATNPSAPFAVVHAAGVAAVTVASAPKVNFAIFSDGKVKSDLTIANVSLIMAKLVPGTNGDPDQWVSYTYRKETAAATVGPNGAPVLATAMQATTDGKQTDAALLAAQLLYNSDGYYTYTFKTDIKDLAQTNGVAFDATKTHRIAIQLSYKNAAGSTVLANPYFDFTLDAEGKAVPVTDPAKTRKMTDVSSCNSCHEKLALHGGGRIDTQYCVMCHNPGTVDANSGNNLNLATMVHKIHAGKLLKSKEATAGGEDYTIWGYRDTKVGFAEVGFPQDLRNCTKCHTGANAATPQGDNWKTKVSKQACLTCHANKAGSTYLASHDAYATTVVKDAKGVLVPTAKAADLTNQHCNDCHKAGTNIGSDRVHWNQNEENGAKYKMNIESTTYDAAARKVTIKYFLSDPSNANVAYNLVTSECTGAAATLTCANTTKFGNLRFYVAYQNMIGQSTAVTEFSSYNNGGSVANAYAYKGTNDGNNHYSVDIAIPADTATAVAFGTARVITIGQIKEPKLQVKWATDPRPEIAPKVLINTVVQNTFKEFAISGALQARRVIVSNDKCNACHGALGTTSGSNTLAEAFHGGARDTVEACVVCHDSNRASSGNMMTNGLALYESYQFKRMIHGIHGNSKRVNPFTHGNKVVGAFNKDGTSMTGGAPLASTGVENYAAEVAWPGVGINCNSCHVNNSYKSDMGSLATVANKPITSAAGVTPVVFETDPNKWFVISPKAATCNVCHDSAKAMAHVTTFGGSAFGEKTQAQVAAMPRESCDDCHAPGGFKGVDVIHGQK
jgi:OmcA/MtrC family decaheme c-type cytochrome